MNQRTNLPSFPGGSKTRVNRAGDNVRAGNGDIEDYAVIERWRAAHRSVLNTFQAILRNRTRNTRIVVAQRHKRRSTILGKLDRYSGMNLARMDDVAGFRLIFPNLKTLHQFRTEFHLARFRHCRRNSDDKYNYISSPKPTGYRGIHDVYEYDVNSEVGRSYKGLLVEIQYRTLLQHTWATAVEVIGFITESQPKFEEGDKRYLDAMALSSEILARSYENTTGPFPDMENLELVDKFEKVEKELNLLATLKGLKAVEKSPTGNRNAILIFSKTGELEMRTFANATVALRELFELEKEMPTNDIVLVKADSSEEIRLAFKNYFSDANEFVSMMRRGCKQLKRK